MARGERNARHLDRPGWDGDDKPFIDPWFGNPPPGYSQPDALDPTGYSLSDLTLPGRLGDGMIPDDVTAPLGRGVGGRMPSAESAARVGAVRADPVEDVDEFVGRVSVSSYTGVAEPVPGSQVHSGLRPYGVDWAQPINPPQLPTMEERGAAGRLPAAFQQAGACSSKEGLGMTDAQLGAYDDTAYVGPAGHANTGATDSRMGPLYGMGKLYLTRPHAEGSASLEYQASGVVPEHLQSTIETGLDVYGGYQGILNPGRRGGRGAYGAIEDGSRTGGGTDPVAPAFSGGLGGDYGPPALSAVGYPVRREVPENPEDLGVDPGAADGWGKVVSGGGTPRFPGDMMGAGSGTGPRHPSAALGPRMTGGPPPPLRPQRGVAEPPDEGPDGWRRRRDSFEGNR